MSFGSAFHLSLQPDKFALILLVFSAVPPIFHLPTVTQCECQSCGWQRIILGTQCCVLSAAPVGLAPDKAVFQASCPVSV